MPITRSMKSKRQGSMKIEPVPQEQIPVTVSRPPSAVVDVPVGLPSTSGAGGAPIGSQDRANSVSLRSLNASHVTAHSKRSVRRAEALERLAKAKLEEARAATALVEAEVARIEAEPTDDEDSDMGVDQSVLVRSWLDTQPKVGANIDRNYTEVAHGQPTDRNVVPPSGQQMIDVAALAAALHEVARTTSHALPKYLQELPSFSGASSEWLAFRAAYRDTSLHFSKAENLTRLRRSLRGVAKEAAISLFVAETEPEDLMRSLETRFGRPDSLVIAEMEKIKTLSRLTDNPRDVCIFASRVNNIVAVVKTLHKTHYLYNPEAVRTVVDKMTPALKYRWYDFAFGRPEDEPDLIKISSFLTREAELCSHYAPAENIRDRSPPNHKKLQRTYATTSTNREPTTRSTSRKFTSTPGVPTCPICKIEHKIRDCKHFRELTVADRWERAKEFNICFRCLNRRSFRHKCPYKPCGVDDCRGSHHSLLHSPKICPPIEDNNSSDTAVVTSTRPKIAERAFLKVLPVTVIGPTGTCDTFALLDEGSTVTLIEESIAQLVGAAGPSEPFEIEGVGGARIAADSSRRVSLKITGKNSQKPFDITARTIDQLDLSPQTIEESQIEKYAHLKDIAQDLVYHRGTPSLLIGQDNWQLIVSRSIRSGVRGQPAASLTELGWVLHGPYTSEAHRVHFVSKITVRNDDEDRMEDLMKNFFDLDGIGIEPKTPKNDPNERALTILENRSYRLPDGRYETGLLWRRDDITLPNNRDTAMKRLENIERKLDRDPKLKQQYEDQMSHLLKSGYAEIATSPPRSNRTWYLPHFAVVNPSKPKPRIVLDAAARTQGVCLNDNLLTGPDLLKSLPGVLMRFRQRRVAVTADIKEMFLQISMREEDRDSLRFLWRQHRREGPPEEYRMRSVIFGAASSPCTAIYILNRNAREHQTEFPEAAEAICNNHYMDDYLQSFDSTEEAVRIASDVARVHRRAKFHLQKWASNQPEVLDLLTSEQERRSGEVKLHDDTTYEKTLGLVWRPTEDHLTFNLNLKRVESEIIDGSKQPTKREALRTIMSLFDPLGLITTVTMPAKRLLQNTWRLGVGWDEKLPEELFKDWLDWLSRVRQLNRLAIDRCYPHYADAAHLEMHTFVDASEFACVAAVYWRAVSADGVPHVSLVMAKGKVAPLKVTSIPRLELQAAVLGCRLARTVETEHDIKPARRVFWSDSRTVLAWLRAGPRTFKPFVAHRVAEIEEETKVSEWRWVPTALNVADDATRDTPNDFHRDHRWFRGPDFLYQPEQSWPQEPEPMTALATGEERVATTSHETSRIEDALPSVSKFSSWLRLIRTTGRVLQFIELCRLRHTIAATKRTRSSNSDEQWRQTSRTPIAPTRSSSIISPSTKSNYIPLESVHIEAAEKLWWKAAQEESFYQDLRKLQKHLPLSQDSKLRALSVILDSEDIIRIRSRIESSDLSSEQRSPPVLDGKHPYTRLYIAWIHRLNHHVGTETVVNEIRSRLWVLRLRPTVRSITKSCTKCRILRAKPSSPLTGDHPSARLAHHQRPFTFVGLDYFGPYSITSGRRHEKRYVALFTCLTTRAVHMELAGSLTTDSAIMALRRMMARRGCPTEIHSDNGTNLRGADVELRRAAYQATKEEATSRCITWRFIPPGSPFMGGAWERLVQSIKRALAATLNDRHPTEEVLSTLLLEAEYTVNNRPLTPVSVSPDDPESLTPLHFILGGPARVPLPGTFNDSDLNAKQRWRHTQRLADMFWSRWIREYVPYLQDRREPRGRGQAPQIGDVVLLVDESLPRNTWPRGQIEQIHPGKDGVVRIVEVRTKAGLLKRAVKKIVVLTSGVQDLHGGRNVHDKHSVDSVASYSSQNHVDRIRTQNFSAASCQDEGDFGSIKTSLFRRSSSSNLEYPVKRPESVTSNTSSTRSRLRELVERKSSQDEHKSAANTVADIQYFENPTETLEFDNPRSSLESKKSQEERPKKRKLSKSKEKEKESSENKNKKHEKYQSKLAEYYKLPVQLPQDEFYQHLTRSRAAEELLQKRFSNSDTEFSGSYGRLCKHKELEGSNLRRSRSLAVIREETFTDLQIQNHAKSKRSQLIPRARLFDKPCFKDRLPGRAKYQTKEEVLEGIYIESTASCFGDINAQRGDDTTSHRSITDKKSEKDDAVSRVESRQSRSISGSWPNLNEETKPTNLSEDSIGHSRNPSEIDSLDSNYVRKHYNFEAHLKNYKDSSPETERSNPSPNKDLYITTDQESEIVDKTRSRNNSVKSLSNGSPTLLKTENNNTILQNTELLNEINSCDAASIRSKLSEQSKDNSNSESIQKISVAKKETDTQSVVSENDGTISSPPDSITSYISISIASSTDKSHKLEYLANSLAEKIDEYCDSQLNDTFIEQQTTQSDKKSEPDPIYTTVQKKKTFADIRRDSFLNSKNNIFKEVTKKHNNETYISNTYIECENYNDINCSSSKNITTEPFVTTLIENQYYSLPDINISKCLRKSERIDAQLREEDPDDIPCENTYEVAENNFEDIYSNRSNKNYGQLNKIQINCIQPDDNINNVDYSIPQVIQNFTKLEDDLKSIITVESSNPEEQDISFYTSDTHQNEREINEIEGTIRNNKVITKSESFKINCNSIYRPEIKILKSRSNDNICRKPQDKKARTPVRKHYSLRQRDPTDDEVPRLPSPNSVTRDLIKQNGPTCQPLHRKKEDPNKINSLLSRVQSFKTNAESNITIVPLSGHQTIVINPPLNQNLKENLKQSIDIKKVEKPNTNLQTTQNLLEIKQAAPNTIVTDKSHPKKETPKESGSIEFANYCTPKDPFITIKLNKVVKKTIPQLKNDSCSKISNLQQKSDKPPTKLIIKDDKPTKDINSLTFTKVSKTMTRPQVLQVIDSKSKKQGNNGDDNKTEKSDVNLSKTDRSSDKDENNREIKPENNNVKEKLHNAIKTDIEYQEKISSVKSYWSKLIDKSPESQNNPEIKDKQEECYDSMVKDNNETNETENNNFVPELSVGSIIKSLESVKIVDSIRKISQTKLQLWKDETEKVKSDSEIEETPVEKIFKESDTTIYDMPKPEKISKKSELDFCRDTPEIEIVELSSEDQNQKTQATLIKANKTYDEFDHVRYKVMKSELFKNSMIANYRKEAQFDGLLQYLQDYSFQELLVNNNIVIIEPVRTKVEPTPRKNINTDTCKIPPTLLKKNDNNLQDKSKNAIRRHFFYHPIRVNKEIIEEELPNPDTVKKVRNLFEDTLKMKSPMTQDPPLVDENLGLTRRATSYRNLSEETKGSKVGGRKKVIRQLTIDTNFGNKKWDNASLSSGVSSGDLSSTNDYETDGLSPYSQKNLKDNVYSSSDEYLCDSANQDFCCESQYVSPDILKKIRECGTSVTYYGGKVLNSKTGSNVSPMTKAIMDEIKSLQKNCNRDYYSCQTKCRGDKCSCLSADKHKNLSSDKRNNITVSESVNNIKNQENLKRNESFPGFKFKLVKSNSCSSRLELTGTDDNNKNPRLKYRKQFSKTEDPPLLNEGENSVKNKICRLESYSKGVAKTPFETKNSDEKKVSIIVSEQNKGNTKKSRTDQTPNLVSKSGKVDVEETIPERSESRRNSTSLDKQMNDAHSFEKKYYYVNDNIDQNKITTGKFGEMVFEEFEVLESCYDSLNSNKSK